MRSPRGRPGSGSGCASPRRGEVAAKALGRPGRGSRGPVAAAGGLQGRGPGGCMSPCPSSWSQEGPPKRHLRAEANTIPRS